MNSRIETLALIHHACWHQLGQAASDKSHAWRVMGLATLDGQRADLRSMVLREVDAGAQQLTFFTDARSPKVAQIEAQPLATLLAWSAALGWQLRLSVRLSVAVSGLAVSSRWARLQLSPAAQDYLSPLPPGAPVDPGQPERASREHFAVLSAEVQGLDWLELHADSHRRAQFDAAGLGQWVTP